MSDYTTANTTSLTLEKFNTESVMTIHPDGRVTVSDKFKPDEAAAKVVEAFKTQWLADVQATKIRELQSNVTELENRLRALWDKLEGERKYYNEHIRQLERELNEANKTISLQHELMTTAEKRGVDKAKEELNEAKDRIKRLEEAGDAMDPMNDTECECDDRSVLICKYCFDSSTRWFKAKEAKP